MVDQQCSTFFEELYDATYEVTVRYLTRRCPDPAEVPDLVQETYATVYEVLLRKGETYLQNPAAFVLHIAKRQLSRHWSFWQRWKTQVSLQRQSEDGEEYEEPIPEEICLPTDLDVESRVLYEQIFQAIQHKPPDVQRIFYLRYGLDLTTRQIAQTLAMKESTVKSKLHRTILELRTLYGKDGTEP